MSEERNCSPMHSGSIICYRWGEKVHCAMNEMKTPQRQGTKDRVAYHGAL